MGFQEKSLMTFIFEVIKIYCIRKHETINLSIGLTFFNLNSFL